MVDKVAQPPAKHSGDGGLERIPNHFLITYHTGLDALGDIGAAGFGAASALGILGAKMAVYILRAIFECADKHKQ